MKIVKIIFGAVAALFAAAHCIHLPMLLTAGAHISSIMGSLTGLCLGAAIAYALLSSALKKKAE